MCSRYPFWKSYLLQLFPQSDFVSFWWSVSLSFCDCTQDQPGRKTWDYCSSHSVRGWPAARLHWEQSSFSSAHRSPWELFPIETPVLSIVRGPPFLFPSHLLSTPFLNLYSHWASFLPVESPLPTFGVLCPVLCLLCVIEWDWGSPPSCMFSGLKHSYDRCPTQMNVSGEIVTPRRSFYLWESSSGLLCRVGQAEVKHHMEGGTIQREEGNPEILCITSPVKDETEGVGGQFDP